MSAHAATASALQTVDGSTRHIILMSLVVHENSGLASSATPRWKPRRRFDLGSWRGMAPHLLLVSALVVAQLLAAAIALGAASLLVGGSGWEWSASTGSLAALGVFLVVFLAVGALGNGLLIRLTLSPLARLEAVARDIARGNHAARVGSLPRGDGSVNAAIETFDEMLDALQVARDRERDVVARVLATEGHERDRLARALFDGPSQSLAETLVRLQVARRHSDLGAPAAEDLRTPVATALSEVSHIARRLQPLELADLGVVQALQARARHLTEETELEVVFQGNVPEARLTPELRVALVRIADEALSNAVAHARASVVRIGFFEEEEGLELRVEDDGEGFDAQAAMAAETGHLGLLEMRWRVSCVGGRLHVESRPHRGTVLVAFLPWTEAA
jgi:signal transduction histidine kinase